MARIIYRRIIRLIMKNELQRMWKEAVVVCLNLMSKNRLKSMTNSTRNLSGQPVFRPTFKQHNSSLKKSQRFEGWIFLRHQVLREATARLDPVGRDIHRLGVARSTGSN
jgi:hypothetical protein